MTGFRASARKEWLEAWRTYRGLVLVVVLLLFGLTSPVTAKYTPALMKLLPNGEAIARLIPTPTIGDAIGQYVKNVSQFGVVLAFLLAMGSVAQEKERGTAAMMLVKPLSRRTFLLAKFGVLGCLFAIAVTVAGVAGFAYTWLLFGPLDPIKWAALNALMLVYLLVPLALTLLFSVGFRSQAAAGGLGFLAFLVLGILGSIPLVGDYLPARLLAAGAGLVSGQSPSVWPPLATSVAVIAGSLAGAASLFERQEL
jgi:ABC-2 type transport system permease protein